MISVCKRSVSISTLSLLRIRRRAHASDRHLIYGALMQRRIVVFDRTIAGTTPAVRVRMAESGFVTTGPVHRTPI